MRANRVGGIRSHAHSSKRRVERSQKLRGFSTAGEEKEQERAICWIASEGCCGASEVQAEAGQSVLHVVPGRAFVARLVDETDWACGMRPLCFTGHTLSSGAESARDTGHTPLQPLAYPIHTKPPINYSVAT